MLCCDVDPQISICCGFVITVGTLHPFLIVHSSLVSPKPLIKRVSSITLVAVMQLSLMFGCLVFLHNVPFPLVEVTLVTVEFVTTMFFPLVNV